MTHAQQNHATAQESSKASAAKAVAAYFSQMVNESKPYLADFPKTEPIANSALKDRSFCIAFGNSKIKLVFFPVEICFSEYWACHCHFQRNAAPEFSGAVATDLQSLAANYLDVLSESVLDSLDRQDYDNELRGFAD